MQNVCLLHVLEDEDRVDIFQAARLELRVGMLPLQTFHASQGHRLVDSAHRAVCNRRKLNCPGRVILRSSDGSTGPAQVLALYFLADRRRHLREHNYVLNKVVLAYELIVRGPCLGRGAVDSLNLLAMVSCALPWLAFGLPLRFLDRGLLRTKETLGHSNRTSDVR